MEDGENHEKNRSRIDNDEILLNLPLKTLVQISCCSRHMKTRIGSHEFAKMHLKISLEDNTNRSLLYSYNNPTVPRTATTFTIADIENDTGDGIFRKSLKRLVERPPFRALRTEIVGHSFGLVCVANHRYSMVQNFCRNFREYRFSAQNPRLAIWNPSISVYHEVPSLMWFELADFEESEIRYPPSYGFGFNPDTDSHEIVWLGQIFSFKTGVFTTQVQIYNLQWKRWERIDDLEAYRKLEIAPGFDEEKAFGSPFLHNHMHWMLVPRERFPNYARVLAFNVRTRRFSDFRAPKLRSLDHRGGGARICSVGDRLGFVEPQRNGTLKVWLMSEYGDGGSWAKAYSVACAPSPYHYCRTVSGEPLVVIEPQYRALFALNAEGFRGVNGGVSFVRSFLLAEDGTKCPRGPPYFYFYNLGFVKL